MRRWKRGIKIFLNELENPKFLLRTGIILVAVAMIFGVNELLILRRRGYVWEDYMGFEGKTFWDLMELFIVPVTLAVMVAILDNRERKADRELALSNQRETALQNYLNFITEMVLDKGLRTSKIDDDIREIVESKTKTTLDMLDGGRKRKLFSFLSYSKLINSMDFSRPVISLEGANFSKTDLKALNLSGADLRAVFFDGAGLIKCNLINTELQYAIFKSCCLVKADLENADLRKAGFLNSNLTLLSAKTG